MQHRIAGLTVGALAILSVVAYAGLAVSTGPPDRTGLPERSYDAAAPEASGSAHRAQALLTNPTPVSIWEPAPQFQEWIAGRYPEPDRAPIWLKNITGVRRGVLLDVTTMVSTPTNTLQVSTSLASDRSAVEPATDICSLAIEFMSANPALGLQAVGVSGHDQGQIVNGSITYQCAIADDLTRR